MIFDTFICIYFQFSASNLQKCSAFDEPCMIQAATQIVKLASGPDGLPNLGIPKIDPLFIKSMVIKQGADRPVNIELNFKDTEFYGLKDTVFTSIK